jgi:hypothetical protein
MREPDLVAQPIRPDHQGTKDTKEVEGNDRNDVAQRGSARVVPAALGALVVEDVVSRGFDRWLERARGGSR